jgi:hypothetical protein
VNPNLWGPLPGSTTFSNFDGYTSNKNEFYDVYFTVEFDRIINKRVQTYFFVEGCIIVGELSRDEIFNQNAALC